MDKSDDIVITVNTGRSNPQTVVLTISNNPIRSVNIDVNDNNVSVNRNIILDRDERSFMPYNPYPAHVPDNNWTTDWDVESQTTPRARPASNPRVVRSNELNHTRFAWSNVSANYIENQRPTHNRIRNRFSLTP